MKKLIAFAIAAIMVLSMIPVMAFTAFADDDVVYPEPDEGFWSTYRDPKEYAVGPDEEYKPTAGFEYTSEGFVTRPADYTNTTPKFTIQTSDPVNLDAGFYMQFRVDEFSYKGESKGEDEWISVSISDRRLVEHGGTTWGNNWLCLIRGNGDGNANVQSFNTVQKTDTAAGGFNHQGDVAISVPMDSDGKEIYEFEVTKSGDNFDIKVNGMSVQGLPAVNRHIGNFEEYYIGITFHSGQKDGVAGATILQQGTSKGNAEVPDGDSEKDAEDNLYYVAPMSPSTDIAAGQPVFVFDGHKTSFKKDPNNSASNLSLGITGDYTYHLTASGTHPYFVWAITNEKTYEAADFPIFAMMLKNYLGDNGGLYYCAGDVLSATDKYMTGWDQWDDNSRVYGGDEEYTYVLVDLSQMGEKDEDGNVVDPYWKGRINSVRPDFRADPADPELCEWDIEFMAFFRSVEDAHAYGEEYNAKNIVPNIETKPDGGDDETKAPDDNTDETKNPDNNTDETKAPAGDDTTAGGESNVADDSTADTNKTDNKPTETKPADEKDSGCSSAIGLGAIAILGAAVAVVLKKKD